MSGLFSRPNTPPTPPLPPAPPVRTNEEARQAGSDERRRRLLAGGRQSTILTSGLGVTGGGSGNDLLGQ